MEPQQYKWSHKSKPGTFKNNNMNKVDNDNLSGDIKGHCDHQNPMPTILSGMMLPWPFGICNSRAKLQPGSNPRFHLPTLQ